MRGGRRADGEGVASSPAWRYILAGEDTSGRGVLDVVVARLLGARADAEYGVSRQGMKARMSTCSACAPTRLSRPSARPSTPSAACVT